MPFILTGVRQAVALGLIGVVVGEMFGGSEGIGYMVNYGGQTFQTDTVFLGVVDHRVRGHRADVAGRAAGATRSHGGRPDASRHMARSSSLANRGRSSHGPLLSTPPEQWDLRAKADRENKNHWFRGKTYDFESLLKERAPGFAHEITVEKRRERFAQCRTRARGARPEVQRRRPRRRGHPRQRSARVLQSRA